MAKTYPWEIHLVRDFGENTRQFRENMCDAHTHGLDQFGSKEIQIVLDFHPSILGHILNTVGERVENGLTLKDGMLLEGICDDGAIIKVFETTDAFGDPVFRLIMPDAEFKFPEESKEYPYSEQYKSPYIDAAARRRQS